MTDILYEIQDQIAIVIFNRPEVLNVMRRAMFQQMLELLDEVAHNDAIRALVITGAGRAFSAGIDLDEVAHLFDGSMTMEQARAELDEMQELTRRMVNLPKPIVAAVNGLAVGAGAEIAISSDIRIASQTASFAFAEVQRGLFETNGVMHRLPRLIGMGRAAQVMLTGEKISAQTALEMGLVTRVLPSEMLMNAALELARTLAANAPISMRLVKQVLHQSYDLDLESVMALETEGTLECLESDDLREGVQAFLEKRAPVYRGK
ncbi:MAG: enoyl-CoA hydratase-related protein [Chloroflexi bacterium]|nr:enoyl-CoA hydratase-related protein [Chloroflexota bacterium]